MKMMISRRKVFKFNWREPWLPSYDQFCNRFVHPVLLFTTPSQLYQQQQKSKKGQNQKLILEQNRILKSQVFLVHLSILIAIFCLVTFSHSFNYKTNFWTRQGFPWYSGICWLWQLCLLSFCGTNLLKQTKIKTESDIQQMNPMPHSSHQSNPISNTMFTLSSAYLCHLHPVLGISVDLPDSSPIPVQ